jgi:protein-tyrosine phosphatase
MELEFAPINDISTQSENKNNNIRHNMNSTVDITSSMKTSKFNNKMKNAHEIIPGLWLGNIDSSIDTEFHKKFNITTIFNCTKDLEFPKKSELKQKHYRIPVHDNLEPNEIITMGNLSFQVIATLDKELTKGRKVLVHCFAGAQRSAAIVVMYLIYKFDMSPNDAILYVKNIRPQAFPRSINFNQSIQFFYSVINDKKIKTKSE